MTKSTSNNQQRIGYGQPISNREINEVLAGLIMALFVAVMSVTIIGSALPTIVATLHGSETQYTWIVTAVLLSSTAAVPIAGRLGDIYDKKRLLIIAISIFTLGSLLSGAVNSANLLIATRVLQGLGMGGLMSLVQTVIASIISPRERGKYNGVIGAVMTVATVSGPLIGGFVVSAWGWRWCLWISVPFCLAALAIIARSLHVPTVDHSTRHVDYWGAITMTSGVSVLLVVISLGGTLLAWTSPLAIAGIAVGLILVGLCVFIELRVPDPVVPLKLLKNPVVALMFAASLLIGLILNAPPVFLTQYFQIGRGLSPAMAGIATLPTMIGSFLSATAAGLLVTRSGRWKPFVVGGITIAALGMGVLAVVDHNTWYWLLLIGMFLFGVGLGASQQNMVLAVQNVVPLRDMGAATGMVTFIRSLGGAIGMQLGGLIFSLRLAEVMPQNFRDAGVELPSHLASKHGSMDFSELPQQTSDLVRQSYGDSLGALFFWGGVAMCLTIVLTLIAKSSTLRDTIDLTDHPEPGPNRGYVAEARPSLTTEMPNKQALSQEQPPNRLNEPFN